MAVDTDAYRAEFRPRIPRWYRGWQHFALTNALLGGLTAFLASRTRGLHVAELAAIPLGFLASNAVEYFAHRYPLHRPMGPLRYIYKAHGIQHHRFFTGDAPEHMSTPEARDFAVLLFGPQSQAGLLLGAGLPLTLLLARAWSWNAALLFGATASGYFLLYEWLHLLYHLPASNPLTRFPGLARLQQHHRRHHELRLMSKWNFNITFPLFDALLGTSFHPERAGVPTAEPQPHAPGR